MPRYATAKFKSEMRELRREQIEKAVLQSVIEHGFPESSLRVVAKDAKLPLSLLHYYFKDKDDLMRCIVKRLFDASMQRLSEAREREHDPVRRVDAIIEAYVMRCTEHWQSALATIEYWAACVRRGTVDRFYTQLHFSYRNLIADALREAGADDPDGLALALLGMMVGYTTFYRSKPADPAERERYLEFARAMVHRAIARGRKNVRLVSNRRRGNSATRSNGG